MQRATAVAAGPQSATASAWRPGGAAGRAAAQTPEGNRSPIRFGAAPSGLWQAGCWSGCGPAFGWTAKCPPARRCQGSGSVTGRAGWPQATPWAGLQPCSTAGRSRGSGGVGTEMVRHGFAILGLPRSRDLAGWRMRLGRASARLAEERQRSSAKCWRVPVRRMRSLLRPCDC